MPFSMLVSVTDGTSRTGTYDDPFSPGGLMFKASAKEAAFATKFHWRHKWIIGGTPIEGHERTPEMWYGMDGIGDSPSFHPGMKTTRSQLQITVWHEGHQDKAQTIECWIMAADEIEPPWWWVYGTDGRVKVNNAERHYLLTNGHLFSSPWLLGRIYFAPNPGTKDTGSIEQLMDILEFQTQPEPEPDPAPAPEPTPNPEDKPDLGTVYQYIDEAEDLLLRAIDQLKELKDYVT